MTRQPIIVAISGASGAIYGIRTLEALRAMEVETHLVVSRAAARTIHEEAGMTLAEVRALASACHDNQDIGASIASGSFRTAGMIIAPCSIKSASEITWGMTSTLLSRAADVVLKERRTLVAMVRETPLHVGHLRTLTQLAEMGAIVAPPVPAFYAMPRSIEDMVQHSVGRMLDLFGLDSGRVHRWEGAARKGDGPLPG